MSTKVCLVKAMVFPAVMYGCERRTIKKAEHWRIDAFELWCWRRLLRVCWTARRSNQSILKEISPGSSLEGLMLKLKLQYFSHLMRRTDSFEKTLMLGKIESGRRRHNRGWDGWMASPTQWTWVWVNSGSWWWTREAWHAVVHEVTKSQTRLSNWTELNQNPHYQYIFKGMEKTALKVHRDYDHSSKTYAYLFNHYHYLIYISTNMSMWIGKKKH